MAQDRIIHMGTGNYNENVEGNYIEGNYYSTQQQDLSEAAAEIQRLLVQLSQTYPADTDEDRISIAEGAIYQVKQNPQLMKRILDAAKAGSLAAMESMLNHPAASFFFAAIEAYSEKQRQNIK